jgi:hypothetical protein
MYVHYFHSYVCVDIKNPFSTTGYAEESVLKLFLKIVYTNLIIWLSVRGPNFFRLEGRGE